ncbi:MAG: hypothetical protein K8F91_16685, partial [Candidatus Obscuribacterales bacterium]|nr:hypothetical protein [Candidatus Obscuribacterales bacterium]
MNKYLCKVREVFEVMNRLVVVSDTPCEEFDTRLWRHGSTVELRRPDGSSLTTKTWYEMGTPSDPKRAMAFSVENFLKKSDVPLGTEVWLIRSDTDTQQKA